MQARYALVFLFALLLLFQFSCGGTPADDETAEEETAGQETPREKDEEPAVDEDDDERKQKEEIAGSDEDPDEAPGEQADREPGELTPEILEHEPNELGEIMILMYHEIAEPEGEWQRTPENFRQDLETLYEQGYRAVSMTDVLRGEIDIPAGTSPVVFTFDDANKGNFNYLEKDGELLIDPDCAVAIMEDFYEEHPDFGLEATFYIYYPHPFRQDEYIEKKLNYLVDRGFEIGNHTYSHANLRNLSSQEVQKELARHVKRTREYLPGYEVNSFALTYGIFPQDQELAIRGSYDGTEYEHEGILLVGSNPAPSPFRTDYDPYRLPRIRASEMNTEGVGMYDWLDVLKDNPRRRYISDGDPRTITAPESLQDRLDEKWEDKRAVRFYNQEKEE